MELIALENTHSPAPRRKLTVDELPASRIEVPMGIGPASLGNIQHAIQGAGSTFHRSRGPRDDQPALRTCLGYIWTARGRFAILSPWSAGALAFAST